MLSKLFTKEVAVGLIRHVVTSLAGVLAGTAIVGGDKIPQTVTLLLYLVSGLLGLAGFIASALHKTAVAEQLEDIANSVVPTVPQTPPPAKASVAITTPVAIITALLFCFTSANAQVNVSGVTNVIPLTTNQVKVVNDLATVFAPIFPYLTNHLITIESEPIVSQGHIGGMLDLQVPTTSNLSLGGGVAYIHDNWYVQALSAKLGTSYTIPYINFPVYMYAESGPSYGFKDNNIGALSLAGAIHTWDINSKLKFIVGGQFGNETEVAGLLYGGNVSLRINW